MPFLTNNDSPPSTSPSRPATHIAFLDGLRAVAALWVLIGHARLFAIGWDAQHGMLGIATNWASYMHLAVDIFIVLSGYCLTLPALRRKDNPESVLTFFFKRARRILPPYYAAALICLALDAVFPFEVWARNNPAYQTQQMPVAVLLTHLFVVQDYLQQYNIINGPFWSIAVEWHIYFFFPLLALVLRRFGAAAALVASAVVALALMQFSAHVHEIAAPYYTLLFGMGVAGASIGSNREPAVQKRVMQVGSVLFGLLAAALIVLLVRYPILDLKTYFVYCDHNLEHDVVVGALTAVGLTLLSVGGDRSPITAPLFRVLSWRPLVKVGTFSFSLYLIHLPVLVLLWRLTETYLPALHMTTKFVLYCTVGLAVILAFSYLFFLGVERPFMTKRRSETPAEVARDAALMPGI